MLSHRAVGPDRAAATGNAGHRARISVHDAGWSRDVARAHVHRDRRGREEVASSVAAGASTARALGGLGRVVARRRADLGIELRGQCLLARPQRSAAAEILKALARDALGHRGVDPRRVQFSGFARGRPDLENLKQRAEYPCE